MITASGPIQLIAGLGNPGETYRHTRHNAGVWVVDRLAHLANVSLTPERKFLALVKQVCLFEQTVHLFLPTTFMNESGKAIRAFAQFYKMPPQAILVIHDDLDLPTGTVRLKVGGGHGGHNGLRSIIETLGDSAFIRLRIGIGRPTHEGETINYVLNAPSKNEKIEIDHAIDQAIEVFPDILSGHLAKAMQRLHTSP